jgi:periplasmic copper chaperone A
MATLAEHVSGLLALAAAMTASATALAHDYKVGALAIAHPWSRATPGSAKVGGGYLKVTNTGAEPDRLVGRSSAVAERFELHQTTVADGVASMRPVEAGLAIRPGETVELKPAGVHVMLVNLKGPLKEGSRFSGTLTFERAGTIPVEFAVQSLGSGSGGGEHGAHQTPGAPTR